MIHAIDLGKFRLYPLIDGYFRLDGGSLFGIVPKTIWGRSWSVDERNRVRLAVRPLLIDTGSQWNLIDTGNGDKFDQKYKDIYGIEGPPSLVAKLFFLEILFPVRPTSPSPSSPRLIWSRCRLCKRRRNT